METSTAELPAMLVDILYAGLVPYIKGSPGIAKSAIVKQVANSLNLHLLDVRAAQLDPSDICGFPAILNGKTSFIPPDIFPISTDPIPEGKDGWLLFLDELSSATPAVAAACYKLILDRMVGQYPLHSNVAIIAAGNKASDKAIVNRMSTAMQSRLVHINLTIKPKEWVTWANENKIDTRIVSFIEFRPDLVHAFNPDHKEDSFACPRTWEFVHKLIKDKPTINLTTTKIIAGTVGEGSAREFKGFCDTYESLPKLQQILNDPIGIPISTQPDVKYAITGLIASVVDNKNIAPIVQFVNRLPLDFQIITWINCIRRNREIYSLPELKDWISKNAKHINF